MSATTSDAQAVSMQPNVMDYRAEIDYRTAHLADQYQRPGSRHARRLTDAQRRRALLRWRPTTSRAE